MKPSGRFKRIIEASEDDTEIIPILYGYLEKGMLPDPFTVRVRGGTGDRKPDGWFHPSSHPEMTERQLYYYLTDPEAWEPEAFAYTIKMSALIGSVVHDVVETALFDLKYLIKPKGVCAACGLPQPSKCKEHGAIDLETGSRGHMDGRMQDAGFEFKTAMPRVIANVRNNDVETFKAKWPYYWAQVQEYMRMTGLLRYKVLFWAMGNPWDMREFTIEADPFFQEQTRSKYLAARRAAELNEPPAICCNPGSALSRACPATSCPMSSL